jgi:hypothetical protein
MDAIIGIVMMIGVVLLIILSILLIGSLPTCLYSDGGLLSRRWASSPQLGIFAQTVD